MCPPQAESGTWLADFVWVEQDEGKAGPEQAYDRRDGGHGQRDAIGPCCGAQPGGNEADDY